MRLLDLAEFGVEFGEGLFGVGVAAWRRWSGGGRGGGSFPGLLEVAPQPGERGEDFLGALLDFHAAQAEQDRLEIGVEAVRRDRDDAPSPRRS